MPTTPDSPISPTQIMGIININDDSFSGDGTLNIDEALEQAALMIQDGADIIDVGAESARTNRDAIAEQEEIGRLLPFIKRFGEMVGLVDPRDSNQCYPPKLSINTWRTPVIEAVLATGAVDIINDISGLPSPEHAELCAKAGAALLIMHTVGEPKVPHLEQQYSDIWDTMLQFFEERVLVARKAGLSDSQIILDPGIDFAKQCGDNLAIYRELERLRKFHLPILLPVSRKTVIGDVLSIENPAERDAGTQACIVRGIRAGADIFRVHNVRAAFESVKVIRAIEMA